MAVVITPTGRRVVHRRGYPFAPSSATSSVSGVDSWAHLSGGITSSYLKLYKTQPWVYIAVNKLAKSVANLPLNTFLQRRSGDREKVRPGLTSQGKLPALFSNPAPRVSEYDFKFDIAAALYIWGNYLGIKTVAEGAKPRGALPTQLWSVPWNTVTVVEGKASPVDHYLVDVGGKQVPFEPDEVVHIDHWKGVSPLDPLRRTLAIEDATLRETVAAFNNGARIAGVFTTDATAKLSKDDKEAIRSEIERIHGGVDNAYKVGIAGGGLDFKAMQFTHQEAELIPIRKLSREEVAAALDIPPPMIGILDHATYSNFDQAHRSFYMESIAPLLIKIEEALEVQLLAPEPEWKGLDLEFDMGEVMKSDLASRAEAYTKLTRVGFTPNHILHMENLPEVNSALYNTGYIPQELMPLDDAALAVWKEATAKPEPAAPVQQEPDENVPALIAASLAMLSKSPEQLSLPLPAPQPITVNSFNRDAAEEMAQVAESLPQPQVLVDMAPVKDAMVRADARAEERHLEQMALNSEIALRLREMSAPKRRKVERDADGFIAEVIELPVEETA